ncbi:PIG-L family deacetylase [Pleurocapsales cyanobacterium LEGE 06147]|nr:PIG-L family deacetylase [Pleurocapsales cyanobacterium LEGE 06147]
MKTLVREFYNYWINHSSRELDKQDLGKSAIVFAPHQDDETLGCGGTIIHKKQAGANLQIVFMTDGCRSHAHLMPEIELKSIRAKEAVAAARVLGVEEDEVIFLQFKDGTLAQNQDKARERVTEIILRYRPEEIFIPYYQDGVPDHDATNKIVISALKIGKVNAVIYEYPIWFWRQWPWTSLGNSRQEILSVLKKSLNSGLGLSLMTNFRYYVDVKDVLELKRAALEQHKSQMTQLIPNSNWLTLADVANGEFLACFFQDYEFFRQYSY